MSKSKKDEDEIPHKSKEDYLPLIDALLNNFTRAVSLNDASDDAMSMPEIMEILRDIDPFIPTIIVVEVLKDKGFQFQFDLKDHQFKWLMKYNLVR